MSEAATEEFKAETSAASLTMTKKDIDKWLDEVDYAALSDGSYVPTDFALVFMNFIKLVNGEEGESHKTPPVHLKMLDQLVSDVELLVNLCFRGAAKTTVFCEYLVLFLAVFGELPGFGRVEGMIYVSDTMENGVKSARKNIESRYHKSDFLQEWLPLKRQNFTDAFLEFENVEGRQLGVRMFGAKTGIRGTKIYGKRPVLAVLDDLLSDEDARSPTSLEAIKSTIYNGVFPALDPTRKKVVFNGTPFNKDDPIIEAVESGAWAVNVWPVCERFPCSEEEFSGAWPDRFAYASIKKMYDTAVLTGKVPGFMQEYMLRISSEEERLVADHDIRWYSRNALLDRRGAFNFYITTDFATSDKQRADHSVISLWAYNALGQWFWVDGVAERQTMDKTIDDLFRLVQQLPNQNVGIEVSGQQQGFIKWLQQEQLRRNVWFNFASNAKSGEPGIRPDQNKLTRFNLVVPLFKAGMIHFPEEMRTTAIMGLFMGQIRLATRNGLKGKDDALDTISMIMYLNPWKPSADNGGSFSDNRGGMFDDEPIERVSAMQSYIV